MPPHCDTMDGPVVTAAKAALKTGNVKLILPYVPKKAEAELKKAFDKTRRVRKSGGSAAKLADYWFFETAVRLHREGEGAFYTGLKPAGLDWGPVVKRAENAIKKGKLDEVTAFLTRTLEDDLTKRFKHAMEKKKYNKNDVDAAREYVHASLGFVLHTHAVYAFLKGSGTHGEEGKGGHER